MSKIMSGYYYGTVNELKNDYPGIRETNQDACDIKATCGTCRYALTAAYTDYSEPYSFCLRLSRVPEGA